MNLLGNTYSLNKNLMPSEWQNFIQHIFRLLITYANNLYPDQAQHSVGPDLDPNCLTLKVFFEKSSLKKISRRQQIHSLQLELPVIESASGVEGSSSSLATRFFYRDSSKSVPYNLQQTTISNCAAFSKMTNKA